MIVGLKDTILFVLRLTQTFFSNLRPDLESGPKIGVHTVNTLNSV